MAAVKAAQPGSPEIPKAIVQQTAGGPEVLIYQDVPMPRPGTGEVLVRHTAIGVNFVDIYRRRDAAAKYPLIPGAEGVGVVEAAGPGVRLVKTGDRVGYATRTGGAYAEYRALPEGALIRLPPDITDDAAATILLKGFTAEYLLHRTHAVRAGETILVHAAAGGMGLTLCRWARAIGARVLGTVSTPEKAAAATAAGCESLILYTREDFAARAKELTGGRGVDVVYDGIGRATFLQSLDALAALGHLISYGQASGHPDPFTLTQLAAKSLTVSRPTLFDYTADRARYDDMALRVFYAVRRGWVQPTVQRRIALSEAAEAHRALEARETIGATVLIP